MQATILDSTRGNSKRKTPQLNEIVIVIHEEMTLNITIHMVGRSDEDGAARYAIHSSYHHLNLTTT